MPDEPDEDGDSGSDAEGASSTSGPKDDATDSAPSADPEETPTWDGESWSRPGEEESDSDGGDAEETTADGADALADAEDAPVNGEDSPADAEDSPADAEDSSIDGNGDDGEADSDAADPSAESAGDEAEPPADRRGSGRARMGSRPPPGDRPAKRPSDVADDDANSDEDRVSHHDPDDFGSTTSQPDYATDKLDDDATDARDEDAEHPDAPGTPDDQPTRNPTERAPRGTAHSRAGAGTTDQTDAARTQSDAASTPSTSVTDDGGSGGSSILSGGIGGSAPPDDEEMPLTEHIEEMLTRLAIVVVVAAFATLAAFPFANDIIIEMWYDVHTGTVEACKTAPQSGDCVAPHVYGPLELVLTRIRVAGLAGLLAALPLGVYQTYRFMRPGLYPHERRYYLAAVPFSLVLAIIGMLFAYFVLLPLLFAYFIGYTQGSADLAFQLAETMNLILLMMGMLAIIFQIPLLIMLAIMMGITTRRWLERRRLYFWGLFLGVAVIFGPDPTGMAPFLLMATMVALFEGTLLLLRWTGR
ncbi:sec-independent protein secretion pathway component tatc [Salinarchaeum sp. Harcht-Bsk1]|uniref:twin-arginine translocase subunit TatC n=1 Tax=Salinarchaeum sp. Harcht-Bsk1 TaxID=1333523 RepID=UPI00034247C6|nr:twin-arginine translocase subunit TatC [Salinarchaeum sp. Harcht-Bsk1]AGN01056.1 sec-independent protein secretion pathway component tatc [Salinarchaeum sp. Harcht-Bsk1]